MHLTDGSLLVESNVGLCVCKLMTSDRLQKRERNSKRGEESLGSEFAGTKLKWCRFNATNLTSSADNSKLWLMEGHRWGNMIWPLNIALKRVTSDCQRILMTSKLQFLVPWSHPNWNLKDYLLYEGCSWKDKGWNGDEHQGGVWRSSQGHIYLGIEYCYFFSM